MKTLLISYLFLVPSLLLAQSDIIPLAKKRSDNTLIAGFETGGKTIKISAAGTLEFASGFTLTGGDLLKTALALNAVPNVDATNMSNASGGTLGPSFGGLGADVSAQSGFIRLNAGTAEFVLGSVGGFSSADSAKVPLFDSGGALTAAKMIAFTTSGTQTSYKPESIDFFNNTKTMQIKPPAAIAGNFTLFFPNISANATLISTNDSGTVSSAMLASTAVTAGSYTSANITVDAKGRITAASNGSGGGGLTIGTTTTSGASANDLLISNGTVLQKITPGTGVATALGNAVNATSGLLTYGIIGTSGAAVPLLNAANTFSAAQTFSRSGAASVSAISLTGTPFSGGTATTNFPLFRIDYAAAACSNWGSGTAIGVNLANGNISPFKIISLQRDSVEYFAVDGSGNVISGNQNRAVTFHAYTTLSNALGPNTANRGLLMGSDVTGIRMASGYSINWSSSAAGSGDAFSNLDIGLARDSAGVLRVSNGSSGVGALRTGTCTIGSTGTPHTRIKSGVAVLVAGSVTVNDSDVLETGTASTSSRIFVTRMTDGGTVGTYSITRVNATSFTITSSSGSDTSTVSWLLLNP